MDYDIALFTSLDKLTSSPPKSMEVQLDRGKIKLSRFFESSKSTLEDAIVDFLNMLDPLGGDVFSKNSVLQIGVYHMLQEAVTFTVRLSSSALAELSKRGVSIEVTAYPCEE